MADGEDGSETETETKKAKMDLKKKKSPTQLTLKYLRDQGFDADVVEKWVPVANVRRDLFGFADIFAFHSLDKVHLLVQTTTASHVSARLRKALAIPTLLRWLKSGGLFHVHGWFKREGTWRLRKKFVTLDQVRASLKVEDVGGRKRKGREGKLF